MLKAAVITALVVPLISWADVAPKNEWNPSWQNPKDGFNVRSSVLGAGTPALKEATGTDVAAPVADGYYHVPGFLPGHPTAATIWPRLQSVDCEMVNEKMVCDGYQVNQATGRGEYVYIVPRLKPPAPSFNHHRMPPVILDTPEPPLVSTPKPKLIRKKKVHRPRADPLLTPEINRCK